MSEEKVESKLEQVTGMFKEAAGKVTGDKELQAEGATENLVGKVKELVTDATDVVEDVKDAATGVFNKLKDTFNKE